MILIIKNKILKTISYFINFFFLTWSKIFNALNSNKPKIFFYTDSRGYNVINKFGKNWYDSYIKLFVKKYRIVFKICPEKYTTIIDFLKLIDNTFNFQEYDYIILHCGVVDFSPRPLSNIDIIKKSKHGVKYFESLFENNNSYYLSPFKCEYQNEPTINLYSQEYLKNTVLPKLKIIDKLIWINSNNILSNWNGNYSNGRPANLNKIVNEFDNILMNELNNVINLKDWDESMIKKYTIDNIHFSKVGLNKIFDLIIQKIESIGK